MHGKVQELTTELKSSSEKPEMVWRRRSTAAGLQHAELVGVDWELPSSIDLTRRSRNPRQSFRASHGGLGCPLATAPDHAWS
jgi:hypothetical protein